jgi:hypothetical protein
MWQFIKTVLLKDELCNVVTLLPFVWEKSLDLAAQLQYLATINFTSNLNRCGRNNCDHIYSSVFCAY